VEYISPATIKNVVSSADFSSVSGWIGTSTVPNGEKATVEVVFGYFEGRTFRTCLDDINNKLFDEN
jgi:hypothetical protein